MAREIEEVSRRLLVERAGRRCEYCLIHEDNAGFPHQIDHIISRKHGGSSSIGNLAYACVLCNRYKGADIASVDNAGRAIRFFDPRRDTWDEHFKLDGPVIQPLTPVGEVTVRMLGSTPPNVLSSAGSCSPSVNTAGADQQPGVCR